MMPSASSWTVLLGTMRIPPHADEIHAWHAQVHSPAPLMSGGNSAVNSFRLVSSGPRCRSGRLSSTDRMACVAHALVMTCRAKNTRPAYSASGSEGRSSASATHLNRKMSPYTGLHAIYRNASTALVLWCAWDVAHSASEVPVLLTARLQQPERHAYRSACSSSRSKAQSSSIWIETDSVEGLSSSARRALEVHIGDCEKHLYSSHSHLGD